MNIATKESIKVGLLGLGKMGINHLRNLSIMKQIEIEFVYDLNATLYKDIADKFSIRASSNLEADLKLVDAVIIVTPTNSHYEYIKMASNYTKHIFVEKPLSDSIESDKKIIQLVKDKQLNIQVGFIERYNPAVKALKSLLDDQGVINIDFVRTSKVNRIVDVDVVLDLMIHDIDLAIHLNGSIKKIDGHGYIKKGMIEYARAIFEHENGAFSNLVASRISEKRIRHISATCQDMYVDCNLLKRSVTVNKTQTQTDGTSSSHEHSIAVQPEEGLLLELLDFVKICFNQEVVVPNEYAGLEANEIANKVQQTIHKTRNA